MVVSVENKNNQFIKSNTFKYGGIAFITSLAINAIIIPILFTKLQNKKVATIVGVSLAILLAFTLMGVGIGYVKDRKKQPATPPGKDEDILRKQEKSNDKADFSTHTNPSFLDRLEEIANEISSSEEGRAMIEDFKDNKAIIFYDKVNEATLQKRSNEISFAILAAIMPVMRGLLILKELDCIRKNIACVKAKIMQSLNEVISYSYLGDVVATYIVLNNGNEGQINKTDNEINEICKEFGELSFPNMVKVALNGYNHAQKMYEDTLTRRGRPIPELFEMEISPTVIGKYR